MKRRIHDIKPRQARRRLVRAHGIGSQVLIDRAHGAAFLSLTRVRVPAGQRTAAAVIHRQEQVWTVVQGVGCFHRAGEDGDHMGATLLSPGDAVFIPPGYTHWVENNGQEDLVFLCCSSPPQAAKRAAQTTVREGDTQMANLFEYKILVSDSDDETDEETLNTLGEQGWELVNAVADVRAGEEDGDTEGDDQNVPVTVFYFKRVRD